MLLSISTSKRSLLSTRLLLPIARSLLLLHHGLSTISAARSIADGSSDDSDDDPSLQITSAPSSSLNDLTVSYLVNSWGLSLPVATSVARRIRIRDRLKPDSVLRFLKDHFFTPAQISSIVSRRPEILGANPRTRLSPKVKLFHGMGLHGADFAKVVTANPSLLCSSLEGTIVGSVGYLKGLVGTNAKVVKALKRDPWLLHFKAEKILAPNIKLLRSHSMPESRIADLLVRQPRSLLQKPERFATLVSDLKELGYDPSRQMFIYALPVLSGMSNAMWDMKVEAYRSCGWSDNEILMAFRRHPDFMLKSVEKIRKVMDFLMGTVHLKPENIMKYPTLITCSLEKTIIPRFCVLNALVLRGILRKDSNLMAKVHRTKTRFEKAFVVRYQDQVPEVLEAYEGKMKFEGFGL